MASYQQVLRARNHAVRTKASSVTRLLDNYDRNRQLGYPQGPRGQSADDARRWEQITARNVIPRVTELSDAMDRLIGARRLAADDAYSWTPPWRWGEIPRNRAGVRRSRLYSESATVLRDATAVFNRYRRTRMYQFDPVNRSWWGGVQVRLRQETRRLPETVGGATGAAVRDIVGATSRAAGAAVKGSGVSLVQQDAPQERADDRSWNLFLLGTVGLGVLILGGGLAVGLASRKKGKKNPVDDFGKRMKSHRRVLRGKAR